MEILAPASAVEIPASLLRQLTALRRSLHRCPELSGEEGRTAEELRRFLTGCTPDELITAVGGHGVIAVFGHGGPTTLLRADMDAVPVADSSAETHRSQRAGVSHACGHDGHMAILAGMAALLGRRRPKVGRVVLLFQPAEETGVGARRVLDHAALAPTANITTDAAFALHVLPGYPRGAVVLRSGAMTAASVGMRARLQGVAAHAAYPEEGLSPVAALTGCLSDLGALGDEHARASSGLVTVVHARLGRPAFGTSPDEAEICATLRAFDDGDLSSIRRAAEDIVRARAQSAGLQWRIGWEDAFPATWNDPGAVELLRAACADAAIPVVELEAPMRWSEDFGHFTRAFPGALCCLGVGEDHPPLHHPDLDFDDALIEVGLRLWAHLAARVHGE